MIGPGGRTIGSMDERKTTQLPESTTDQSAQTDGRTMLEQAFARGSQHLDEVPPVTPERTEHSVMEGLPPAKAERIAAMRRELAELQRQLIEAQQRIATELQGRAEDAERFEALETRLQAQEVKAQEDATRNAELVTEVASVRSQLSSVTTTTEELRREVASRDALLETRTGELATRTTERDTEQAARSRLERELEEQGKQHREVTSQLESQVASLRDANALIATRDAELTTITSERDALKGEVAAARAKLREVADQLARFGQDLLEGTGGVPAVSSTEPTPAVTARSTERTKPPPVPPPRTAAPTESPQVETILEVTEEPKSSSRVGVLLITGVLLGCVATIVVGKWRGTSTSDAGERRDVAPLPSAALVSEGAAQPASPPPMHGQGIAAPGASSAQPTPVSDIDVSDQPNVESDSRPTASAEIATDGVLVLPDEAADHRVFVDGRVVPVKNLRAVVRCGTREIRIGSRGTSRTLDVACGGETVVPAPTRDR